MPKILVIEDAHLLRNDILETLTLEGFEVIGAENGRTGLQLAREHRPDLIVCDIMMPELDGYGVLEALRKDPTLAMTPFIFMTAKTDKTDIRLGMGLGADDYLTKPFLTIDLLNTIHARLGKRALQTQEAERKLEELRESIITALPHELRTPLNTIIGFSEMLISDGLSLDSDKVIEWGKHINTAALRLYRLIENYLVYVRIEILARDSQKAQAFREHVLHEPAMLVQLQAQQKAQQYNRSHDLLLTPLEDAPGLRISEQDLNKILEEVIDNAFKFSEENSAVQVSASLKAADDYVISIANRGRRMSAEQIAGIGAYMQFDRWLYEQQGMGMGLTIAKRLTELAGGKLVIQSSEQGLTEVQICLPVLAR